ncbi:MULTISPECIES: polyprenol monophosphomannose synthase [Psychrilyobacter]|uniref:Glycosyltransferase n=1 Tax=Psychrilyobacter piezotolerans TaxID=2293438 RepID=A0ABX9KK54_9FUSO|nr:MULTISPECIES: polyprenol monophosphomannose synthase [Psychrilyobacter]MCS5420588.1 polyprenol monophosphomannose synthase [Psychrilyobacter sp. S5]NDI76617.1 polyprenol monophosphomannose synthase [Psychrilyobacter piezotolerans]RDE65246.1 polyprenol monophosphomannose synthase [Psychrilyobacter sp. S5]REI42864.1 glycosyltransferase [Psychrilyobacter piezotolerans]
MKKTLIIIPTYNESENVEKLLETIYRVKNDLNILIVDDNSPDKTYEVIEKLMVEKYKDKLFIHKRSGKLGLGTAYIAGFKWALARDYDYIFEMDADFSHNPKYIPEFLKEIETHDLVIGSRYVPGGGVVNWGIIRKFISRGGSLYSRIILGAPIKDFTGGFKCFRRKTLENLNLDRIVSNGYSFQVELNYKVWLKGMKIKETPIIFEDRTLGQSKMSKKIFLEAILKVLWMRLNKKYLKEN